MSAIDVIEAAQALLAEPGSWKPGVGGLRADGSVCSSMDRQVVRLGVLGALFVQSRQHPMKDVDEAIALVDAAVERILPEGQKAYGLFWFEHRSTHEEVLAMLRAARS